MSLSEPERAGLREAIGKVLDELGSTIRTMAYQEDTTGETNAAFTDAEDELLELFESTAKEVIGKDSHTPLFEDRPNGPHIMDTEKNELRSEQLARLAALLRGEGSS